MHPTQVGLWKKELQEQAGSLFEGKRSPQRVDESASMERLYSEIGRLKHGTGLAEKKVRDHPLKARQNWIEPGEALVPDRQCALAGVSRTPRREPVPSSLELELLVLIDAEYTRHPFHGSRRTPGHAIYPYLLRGVGSIIPMRSGRPTSLMCRCDRVSAI